MVELMQAATELFVRPEDECFPNLSELYAYVYNRSKQELSSTINLRETARFVESDGEIALQIGNGNPIALTNYSAEQICGDLKIPFKYLNELPIDLALDNLNCGLARFRRERESVLLLSPREDDYSLRTITSDLYTRIYDHEVVKYLLDNLGDEWRIAPTWEGLDRGLYAGDRDMFIFLINGGSYVEDGWGNSSLHRGFFVRNSEVKACSLEITTFLHRGICGNHIVWGAEGVTNTRIRHVGDAVDKFREAMRDLLAFTDSSAHKDLEDIERAKRARLGATKDEVVDKIRSMFRSGCLGKKLLEEAYDLAMAFDEDARVAWGMSNGLTRLSQDKFPAYQNKRAEIDRFAGLLLTKVLT